MDTEEHEGVQQAGDRCEECGVKLTELEQREALLGGGPVLCRVHATETAPLEEPEDADAPED